MLAVYEHEARATPRATSARAGSTAALARAPRSRRGSTRCSRSGSTRAGPGARTCCATEGARLQADFPDEFAAILAGAVDPLDRAAPRVPDARSGARRVVDLRGDVGARRAKLRGRADHRDEARAHVLRFCLPALGMRRSVNLPPIDSDVLRRRVRDDAARAARVELQEELLLEMLPYAYEHAPLIRETWDDAGVHPRDIRSRSTTSASAAPFVDKDAVRRFRDERGDPYGGAVRAPARRADRR